MSLIEPPHLHLSSDDEQTLLDVAVASIQCGLGSGKPQTIDVELHPAALRTIRASFVTLRIAGQLRGCMGAITAVEPLVADVARNAFAAAFRDPRFPPLERDEAGRLDVHISVLSPPNAIEFETEADLLSRIRPEIDGLTLFEGSHRATLLPAVWRHVSTPRDFLAHLKRKAGLPTDYWSSTLRIERYTAYSIGHD
jgi:AmmeMemoRadiSam system protein A